MRDAPPDIEYRDTGCELQPACLSCALPRCRWDDPGWHLRDPKREERNHLVREASAAGANIGELMAQFGVSKRTVNRILTGQ